LATCLSLERKAMMLAATVYLAFFTFGFRAARAHSWSAFTVPPPHQLDPWSIFTHNVLALSFLWLGVWSFGIITIFALTANALIHGFSLGTGNTPLLRLLPYGAFEIPAIWIAGGVGLARGLSVLFKTNYPCRCARRWVMPFLILLAIAAELEALR